MDCEYSARLDGYHDDELSDADARALKVHLDTCDSCRETLAELAEIRDAFRRLPEETMSSAALARAHAAAEASAEPLGSQADLSVTRFALLLTGLAASVMIIATAWLQTTPEASLSQPVAVVETSAAPEWERVAITLDVDQYRQPANGLDPQQMLADTSMRDARVADWILRNLLR
jgi:anti-sigma factor RsiW